MKSTSIDQLLGKSRRRQIQVLVDVGEVKKITLSVDAEVEVFLPEKSYTPTCRGSDAIRSDDGIACQSIPREDVEPKPGACFQKGEDAKALKVGQVVEDEGVACTDVDVHKMLSPPAIDIRGILGSEFSRDIVPQVPSEEKTVTWFNVEADFFSVLLIGVKIGLYSANLDDKVRALMKTRWRASIGWTEV